MKFSEFDTKLIERIQHRFSHCCDRLEYFLDCAKTNRQAVGILEDCALDIVRCGIALGESVDKIRDACLLAASVSSANFFATTQSKFPVKFDLINDNYCQFDEPPSEGVVHAHNWLRSFFLNLIARREDNLNMLCSVSPDVLKKSSTKDPMYRESLVKALISLWTKGPNTNDHLIEAMEYTDPERDDVLAIDYTLDIDVGIIDCTYRLYNKDKIFPESLNMAATQFEKFWSKPKRVRDWGGFWAIELTGIAALAYDRGMSFTIDHERVPNFLVNDNWTKQAT